MRGNNLIAAAVLLGCIIIAIAHYLGLKAQVVAPPMGVTATAQAPAEPPQQATDTPPAAPPAPAVPPPAPPTQGEVAVATAEVERVLSAKKAELTQRCWLPLIAAAPEPALGKFILSLGFAADGALIRYEVNMVRNAARPDVAGCLLKNPLSFTVSAPGKAVNVNVPLEFP